MDFISNQPPQNKKMLEEIGISSLDQLFDSIPESIRQLPPEKDEGCSEFEVIQKIEQLAQKNESIHFESYLGGGAYDHHIPSMVGPICSKSEFLTAYTPYQPEISQGILQVIFEFQSAICALTSLDVSNASVYDGASACAESALMALRIKKNRQKIGCLKGVHPHYQKVTEQYLSAVGAELNVVDQIEPYLTDDVAAILIQLPNFFGSFEDLEGVADLIHKNGSLLILCANPIVYGLFGSAGELGADIAVGDTQPLGIPSQFGGPYVGYMACRNEFMRQMPGRIVGETVDTQGRRGFVLTLQAREQHIRREKATSNICSNQTLASLASLITILWYGKRGLKELAYTNYQRTCYLKEKLQQISGVKIFNPAPTFNEFVIQLEKPVPDVLQAMEKEQIIAGLEMQRFYPKMENCLLVTVTETKNLEQLNRYIQVLQKVMEE